MKNLEDRAIEEEIDGVMYRVWPVPFSVGRPALVRLLGIVGPLLSAAVGAKSNAESGASLFSSLSSTLSDADLTYFAKLFGDASKYRNDAGDWVPLIEKSQAAHFDGRYLAYFQWIALAARVNFAGFFTGMKDAVAAAGQASTEPAK